MVHLPRQLVTVALDGVGVFLTLLWLFTVIMRHQRGEPIIVILRATLAALVISYIIAHVDRWFYLWPYHPDFPSGHETFASCIGTALVIEDRRYLWLVLPLLALLGYGLVRAGWHVPSDVAGGFLLGTVVMLICYKVSSKPT